MNVFPVQNAAVPASQYVQAVPSIVGSASEDKQSSEPIEALRAMRLRAEYGAWFLKRNGRWFLNDGFWGAWLCERLGVFFDPESDVFRTTLMPMAENNRLSARALVEPVNMLLAEAAKALAPAFPVNELRDRRVRRLIEIMKVVPRSKAFSKMQPPADSTTLG